MDLSIFTDKVLKNIAEISRDYGQWRRPINDRSLCCIMPTSHKKLAEREIDERINDIHQDFLLQKG